MDLGFGRRGVDMGPSAIRIAGLDQRLVKLGHEVIDDGDIVIKSMEELEVGQEHARYLTEIARAANVLAKKIERILSLGHFPLVLGEAITRSPSVRCPELLPLPGVAASRSVSSGSMPTET